MPIDPHAKRFLERLAASKSSAALQSVSDRRTALQQLLTFGGRREEVKAVEDRLVPGAQGLLRARLYTPLGAADSALPTLIYFHGGGLVAGNLETHDQIARALSNASGCRLISIDYRLAPEAPFPAAVEDGYAATRWVAEHADELGADPDRLGLCGDSAGATLAAVVAQAVGARGDIKLALQFLLCPIMDFRARTQSRRAFGEGYFLDQATLTHDLEHYLGSRDESSDPRVSPLMAQAVGGLPPSCVHTAEFDPLRDEGEAYALRLQRAGIRTTYRCHPGMIHLFYGLGALIPYAADAFRLAGADIRAMLAQ